MFPQGQFRARKWFCVINDHPILLGRARLLERASGTLNGSEDRPDKEQVGLRALGSSMEDGFRDVYLSTW